MFGEVVDRHNVGMFQLGDHLGFAAEARQEVGVLSQGGVHPFDRHIAVQGGVVGFVHGGHAPLSELFDDPVGAYVFAGCKSHGFLQGVFGQGFPASKQPAYKRDYRPAW